MCVVYIMKTYISFIRLSIYSLYISVFVFIVYCCGMFKVTDDAEVVFTANVYHLIQYEEKEKKKL